MNFHTKTIIFIAIAFLLRLAFTTQPPVEYEHTWRQATGLMYARNFVETDANFFHPRIDDNAGGSGILVLDAPILYYGMYLISVPFGYQDWYGRLINLIISSLGLYFFYLVVRRFFTERVAFYATLILTTSLWLIFSRKTMQDTMAISFLLMALYHNFNYFRDGRLSSLIWYAILATLGMLSKIPAGMYLIFPVLYLLRDSVDRQRIWSWAGASLIPVVTACLWYFWYAPYALSKYGYWNNTGESFPEGFINLVNNTGLVLERFFFHSLHSLVFLILFILSWIIMMLRKDWNKLWMFGCFTGVFILYMVRSGIYFVWHNYYMVPYIPVMAIMIAWVLEKIPRQKWALVLLVIGMAEGIVWQARDFTNSPQVEYKMKLTSLVDEFASPDDKIILVNNGNPVGFYFAHRKGWLQSEQDPLPMEKIKTISGGGARILIINKHFRDHTYDLPLLYEDADYRLFDISEKSLSF